MPKLDVMPVRRSRLFAEHVRLTHFAEIPAGVSLETTLNPAFWQHYVSIMNKNDLVELVAEDGSFDALARVTDKATGFVKLRILRSWHDEEAAALPDETGALEPQELPRLELVRRGSGKGWRILGINGEVYKEGVTNKREAYALLDDYKARMSAD